MKKLLTLILTVFIFSVIAKAQTANNLDIGIDFTMPTCKQCTTLHALYTPYTANITNYTLNQKPYTPYPYSGNNIPVTSDDAYSGLICIPFDFYFFGNSYNQCIVGSNGILSFNTTSANGYCPWSFSGVTALPNPGFAAAKNSIMCPYHDLYPPTGGTISWQVYGVAPNRVFVVSWNLMPMFQVACNVLLNTQQIAIYETTNKIETYIANKDLCTSWNSGEAIHGIEDQTGTIAIIVPGRNLPTQWTAINDAWEFIPNGTGPVQGAQTAAQVDWFDYSGNLIATNVDSLVVCPIQTTTFYAKQMKCGFVFAADTINIIKQDSIKFTINSITDANCYQSADGAINFSVVGGTNNFSYTINSSPCSTNVTGLTANTYTIVATDGAGCTASTLVTVNEPTKVKLSVVDNFDVLCKYQNTGQVHLAASGGVPSYSYWFGNSLAQTSPNFDSLFFGNYTFYTKDSHGCADSATAFVNQPDSLLSVFLTPTVATCINKKDGQVEANPSGGIPNYSFEWNTNPKQYSQTATDLTSGVYHVVVTDANGCITATQVAVDQQLCCQLFLPDAFTPNGDLHNDVYKIIEYGGGIILGEFKIYNRWGQEIFSTNEISKGWDGTFKGVEQNMDTYNYIMTYQCNDKGIISQKIAKGDFILIR